MRPKQHAGVWLAFGAGMFADAIEHAAHYTDEQIDPDDAPNMFLVSCGESLDALAVDHGDALKTFEKGRQFMRELRGKGLAEPLAKPEDGPPLSFVGDEPPTRPDLPSYTGPERQLTGKPDRRLS